MSIFGKIKRSHLIALGQAEAIGELERVSGLDFTKFSEAELSELSMPIADFLDGNLSNWNKEDFVIFFIVRYGSSFAESRITTKLFYDAAMSYITSNKNKINSEIMSASLRELSGWQSQHLF